VVAETAPETSAPAPTAAPEASLPEHDGSQAKGDHKADAGGGSQGQAHRPQRLEPPPAKPPATPTELPSGSSGLGEVIAEATGSSSSGGLGMLLPLAIAGAIAWSLAFLWRQRRPAE
jgi:hypothetical protein